MSKAIVNGALGPMELQRVERPLSSALKNLDGFRVGVGRCIARIGWAQKRAALEMGIPETQFSRQLAGTEHLSLWRMHALPREFWQEMVVAIVEHFSLSLPGMSEQDRMDMEFGRSMREAMERRGVR